MGDHRSFYDLLNISPTASASEIRRAYVRMMKQHHPDARASDPGAPDLSRVLNRGYAILRDPEKRARYDWRLSRASKVPTQLGRTPRRTAAAERILFRLGMFASAGLAAGLLVLSLQKPSSVGAEDTAGWQFRSAGTDTSAVQAPVRTSREASRIAFLAKTLSVGQAERLSRDCFASATDDTRPGAADNCVLFDLSFLYWQATPRAISTFPPYFADDVVSNRHRAALAPYGRRAAARLSEISSAAFWALVAGSQAARFQSDVEPNVRPADRPDTRRREPVEESQKRTGESTSL